MKMTKILFIAAVVFLTAGSLSAQKSGKDAKEEPFEMRLNLTVRNAAGQIVNDVKKEDIKIFEDNVEQKITRFSKKDGKLNLGLVVDNSGSLRMRLPWLVNIVNRSEERRVG